MDAPILLVARWEVRSLRASTGWRVLLGLIALAAAVGMWNLASVPTSQDLNFVYWAGLLVVAPIRSEVADLHQMTFGYVFLRFSVYTVILLSRLLLPGLAGGTVGNDRRAGRLQDFQLTLLRPAELFLGKALGAAAPFLGPAALVFAASSAVLAVEMVSLAEAGRLILEACSQVLMTAFVTLACSTVVSHPWFARIVAYIAVWALIPTLWGLTLWWFALNNLSEALWELPGWEVIISFGRYCALEAGFTVTVCAVAFVIGVARLHPHGFRGLLRRQERGANDARDAGRA